MIAGKSKGDLVMLAVKAALIGAVLFQIALFVVAAIYRLASPYGLEWPEQFSTLHALSMLRGNPIYSAPSMEATSTVYTPGLALVIALGIKIGLPPMQIGRVVSLCAIALACFLLYRIVRREGGTPTMSLIGVGIFLGGYEGANRVYDMARVDPSAIALLASGLYLVTRHEKLTRATIVGVALLALTTFFKQNFGLVIVISLGALCVGDRRKGLYALGSYFLMIGSVALLFDVITDGWFHRWTWTIGAGQPLWMGDPFALAHISWGAMLAAIFFRELPDGVPALFLVAVALLLGHHVYTRVKTRQRWREAAAACEGPLPRAPALINLALVITPLSALLAAIGPRMKVGGGINGWALVFYTTGLCTGLLLAQARRYGGLVARRTAQLFYAGLLVYGVYGLLSHSYDPWRGKPSPRAKLHLDNYQKVLHGLGAPVLAPHLPVVTELRGGGPQIMATTLLDLVWGGRPMPSDFYTKRDRRHWKAIVLPAGCNSWPPFRGALDDAYVALTPIKLPYFQPTGEMAHHWIWLPRPSQLQPRAITLDFERKSLSPKGISLRFEGKRYKGWFKRGSLTWRRWAAEAHSA